MYFLDGFVRPKLKDAMILEGKKKSGRYAGLA